ncbi:MAG: two-component sensor histidine kinase [Hamadaea sp.]|uniref:sensor histidine kinase n=1 Tax=Hamadaea sp. TaxID=2024425 RepID=UPI00183ED15B|nr:histidine kinase [Hamadaea sp.]NUR73164.1 two-component sensor histidine kinase [Hamadaea sp.]NUT18470.1 two-component sensor histidine kinase [Hamadaea sp.]
MSSFLARVVRDLLRTVWGPDPSAPAVRRPAKSRWFTPLLAPVGVLAWIGLTIATQQFYQDNRHFEGLVAAAMAVLVMAPVLFVRIKPVWTWRLAAVGLVLGAYGRAGNEAWPWVATQVLVALVVLFYVALRAPSGVTLWSAVITCVLLWSLMPNANGASATLLIVVVVILGQQIQVRRRAQAELHVQEERSELAEARRALLEERARIARELHDVVAHSMSLLAVRAETAPYRLPDLPDSARAEFLEVAASARQTLVELRRMLGALRTGPGEPERAPQPALADLPELIGTARHAGLRIDADLTLDGEVSPAAGLAAYRIVQEALSNAARHAAGTQVHVTVQVHSGLLDLLVRNEPGPEPATSGGSGHGLLGMRERALVLGGTLRAEPTADGGFEVAATLPVGEAE